VPRFIAFSQSEASDFMAYLRIACSRIWPRQMGERGHENTKPRRAKLLVSSTEPVLTSVLRVLHWEHSPEPLLQELNAFQTRAVSVRVSRLTSGRAPFALLDRIRELSIAQQARILLAPECCRLVFSPKAGTDAPNTIASYIEVERYLCGNTPGKRCGDCTILGDVYWPVRSKGVSSDFPAELLRPDGSIWAPTYNGIVIDCYSPLLWAIYPEESGPMTTFSPEQFGDVRSRVHDVMTYLRTGNGHAAALVEGSTKVLALAKTRNRPNLTLSNSRKDVIGITAVANLLSPEWTISALCDSVLHEAIHSLLFRAELLVPFHFNYSEAAAINVTSPWSSRKLPLPAFVHACFVWYGLWLFWRSLLCLRAEARDFVVRCDRGFIADPIRVLRKDRADEQVSTAVMTAIEKMCDEVWSIHDCGST
jgi:hypothetical protein